MMTKECEIKFFFKEMLNKVLFRAKLSTFTNYESIKRKIFEKTKSNNAFNSLNFSEKDKFILEISNNNSLGEIKIWDEDSFNYFLGKMQITDIDKIKFNIVKVKEYPKLNIRNYKTILTTAIEKSFDLFKKEIKDELTENYLFDGKRAFIEEKRETNENMKDDLFNGLHLNVICNNCLSSNFSGIRFVCSECNNFNLCEYCQENARFSHDPDHTFIKINNPILEDIEKYNCIFAPNRIMVRKSFQPFEIQINCINNGEMDLKKCFLSPIRFGSNYLGCAKKTIVEECQKGDQIKMNVLIKFSEYIEELKENEIYEGYFRLMTYKGIPFGDIFYIQLILVN